MKNRWISKTTSTRQERRGSMGSMGCDDISSKDSYCLSPNAGVCVNGIPDWENPMEATLTSIPNNETSPPMGKTKSPIDANTRRRNSLSNSSAAKHPISPQKQAKTQNPAYFARMVIECDDKFNHSDGELTFDESLAHDENFGHVQPNYQIPREIMKEKKIPSFQSPPQIPTRTVSMRSSSTRSHPSISTSSSSIPVSPGMSLEEEEMRQLEIAMERSMQDLNSCASYGNGSLLSERSYTNTVGSRYTAGGRNKISDSGSANSMTGAGCHLGMVSSSSFRNNQNHTVPTKSSSQNRMDALHAIVEENEASSRSIRFSNHHHHRPNYQHEQQQSHSYLDDQYSSNGYRSPNRIPRTNIDPNLAAARIRELEREKEMLEMVLKDNSNTSAEEQREIHFQPPPMTVRPTLSSNRSINSMNTNELLYQPPRNPTKKSASFRSTDVPSAGCHLQMYAARSQSSRHLNGSDNSSTSLTYNNSNNNTNHNNHNSQSNASSSSSSNTKLVWKRGPNGAWGRFLDDGIDYSSHHNNNNNSNDAVPNSSTSGNDHYHQYHHRHEEDDDDDEDAQIAEALRRSMQQM